MTILSGLIYHPRIPQRFFEGTLEVEGEKIVRVSEGIEKGDVRGIILPSFVNAHTHLADGLVCDTLPLDLDEAVTPPNGIKHQKLEKASEGSLVESIRSGLASLALEGVGTVCDFREGGEMGLRLAREAVKELPLDLLLLGRPERGKHDLFTQGDGIGLSSVVGNEPGAKLLSGECKKRGKLFSFHHAEARPEPLAPVLDLTPDFIVHGTYCTREDLEELSKANIDAVVCPGMNALFGSIPPMREMLDSGMSVGLGTDNAMARPPSILEAMGTAFMLSRLDKKPLEPTEVLDMAIAGGRKALRLTDPIEIMRGQTASMAVFPMPRGCNENNAANVVVNHARVRDVLFLQRGEWTWKHSRGY